MTELSQDFWMKAAAWSFGAWAVLLAIIGWLVAKGVDNVLTILEQIRSELRAFTIQMEHRVTQVEAENMRDRARLDKLESK